MDGLLLSKLTAWYEALRVDGWVEVDAKGHVSIELFALAVQQLNLKQGDYIRVQVMRKETLDAPEKHTADVA